MRANTRRRFPSRETAGSAKAMEAMADYFDQAKLHGLKNFRIIHGDGTGRLRKAVHEKLRNDPSVKEFRLGMPQEGGTGATVVELK